MAKAKKKTKKKKTAKKVTKKKATSKKKTKAKKVAKKAKKKTTKKKVTKKAASKKKTKAKKKVTKKKAASKKKVKKVAKKKVAAKKKAVPKKKTKATSDKKTASKTKAKKADSEKAASKQESTKIEDKDTVIDDFVDDEIFVTDAEGRRLCQVTDCDQVAMVDGYCRYHYLLNWKKIQIRKKIISEGKLQKYIEELTAKYPDKYIEILRKDLRSNKEFMAAIHELQIEDSSDNSDYEDEAQSLIAEMQGVSDSSESNRDDY